ncbi:zinc finger protein-like protein [Tasmannia lanceolata]|uniref:zinc finger protein-like protein n=1 Tax=Tasmannia lanceolata TaxID=3420 RepID=UPI00406386BD
MAPLGSTALIVKRGLQRYINLLISILCDFGRRRMGSESKMGEQRGRSLFDFPSNFFNSCSLLSDNSQSTSSYSPFTIPSETLEHDNLKKKKNNNEEEEEKGTKVIIPRWSCNTCKAEFDSLQDQRYHFKSDFHRFNVKLSVARKSTIKEEEFDELTSESLFRDYDVSSISGSEDEAEKGSCTNAGIMGKVGERGKHKLFIRLKSGDVVSVWKCLLLDESEDLSFENNKLIAKENGGCMSCLREDELVERLKRLIREPRDKTRLRTVLLASGGHFAGCVFDGNSLVAHKTFHRYVVRAKAGKQQSAKDGTGKAAKSAGASLRRYNELALKKEIQELLASWKPYLDASSRIFIHAPSNNRQLFFDGEKVHFSRQNCVLRHLPLTVRRPTLKEAKRIYNHLTLVVNEVEKEKCLEDVEDTLSCSSSVANCNQESDKEKLQILSGIDETPEASSGLESSGGLSISSNTEDIDTTLGADKVTPLHEAARSGNAELTLELLQQGLDPCIKDPRGRTPYMMATEKEVRNTFRRFMALNLDKWDWHAANVPSPLTKEMEDSQAAKQAEKDAKKKAKAKELKKLRKVKEKAAQEKAALLQNPPTVSRGEGAVPVQVLQGQTHSHGGAKMSKEEELKRAQAAERELRAAAAERRIAALNAMAKSATTSSEPKSGESDISCSYCKASLAGKVPFHRYNYKYCSTSCMHVHREMLEVE